MPAVALPVDPGDIRVDAVRDRYRLSALGPDHAVGLLAASMIFMPNSPNGVGPTAATRVGGDV